MANEQKNYEIVNTGGVLPADIYEATNLDMKDILAPAAIKITPKEINIEHRVTHEAFALTFVNLALYLGDLLLKGTQCKLGLDRMNHDRDVIDFIEVDDWSEPIRSEKAWIGNNKERA